MKVAVFTGSCPICLDVCVDWHKCARESGGIVCINSANMSPVYVMAHAARFDADYDALQID
jgi:hypothetical protein